MRGEEARDEAVKGVEGGEYEKSCVLKYKTKFDNQCWMLDPLCQYSCLQLLIEATTIFLEKKNNISI